MRRDIKIADSMLELIGDIPLVRLNRVGKNTGAEILVKPEFLNPSGSIKDRIAKMMIEDAEKKGLLRESGTVIEATTGNTGTALAFVSAVKGYKMVAYAPGSVANPSRAAIMLAYGCEMKAVDTEAYEARIKSGDESDSSVHGGRIELLPRQLCLELEQESEDIWWARQFNHEWNVGAHREWTAAEILDQTGGKLDVFIASVGTGGTLLGVAQTLKNHDPDILVVGVEPAGAPMLGAKDDYPIIPGISDGIIPAIWESGLVDRVVSISDQEAIDMAHQLAKKEGMFCGMSSGANVLVAVQIAEEIGAGKRLVTVLPDSRDRYLAVEKYTT
jgi:cysteine synthase A